MKKQLSYKLIISDVSLNEIKKIALLLGRDFKEIEDDQKKKGKEVKTDLQLLTEIETEIKNKKKKK